MKIAVLSDIHSNLEALTACIDHARSHGAERFVFLGDMLGYGADPCACLDIIIPMVKEGALAVLGNHDEASLGGQCERMGFYARDAIYWTRKQLQQHHRDFLMTLPMIAYDDGTCFVHASAAKPESWPYIEGPVSAAKCIASSRLPLTVVGHLHHQVLYFSTTDGKVGTFNPTIGAEIKITPQRQWLAIAGSVGQPRDGTTAAAYLLLDKQQNFLTFYRVPYDHWSAERKVREAGLSTRYAFQLGVGT